MRWRGILRKGDSGTKTSPPIHLRVRAPKGITEPVDVPDLGILGSYHESCCLSILLAVETRPPARAEGLVKLSVGEGEHRCTAAALGRSAAREPYAGKHDSDCRGLSQPDKLV